MAANCSEVSRLSRISEVRAGCFLIISNSDSSRPPGFFKMSSGIPILPRSCSRAPWLRERSSSSSRPRCSPRSIEYLVTFNEWLEVLSSLASRAFASANSMPIIYDVSWPTSLRPYSFKPKKSFNLGSSPIIQHVVMVKLKYTLYSIYVLC